MNRKDVARPGLLTAALSGRVTNREVAAALRLSIRQVQRLKRRYAAGGVAGLLHAARGRASPRRLSAAVRQQILTLWQTRYAGFNDVHFTEKLVTVEGIAVSRETVRRLRCAAGWPAKQPPRAPRYYRRRLREAAAGRLVHIDGSPFPWLGADQPPCTAFAAVDDATGALLALSFRPHKDLHGYAVLLQQLATTVGLPLTLYGDPTNILVRTDAHWTLEEELAARQEATQLGRVLAALAIGYIAAATPQAKGRIERQWRTGQDRLTAEIRLRGLRTVDALNAAAPELCAYYTACFGRPPRSPHALWRRPPGDFVYQLACRYQRVVRRDNTVTLAGRVWQLPPRGRGGSWQGQRVDVRELLDGRLIALHEGHLLAEQPAPPGPFTLRPRLYAHRRQTASRPRTPLTCPAAMAPLPATRSHPWRHSYKHLRPSTGAGDP